MGDAGARQRSGEYCASARVEVAHQARLRWTLHRRSTSRGPCLRDTTILAIWVSGPIFSLKRERQHIRFLHMATMLTANSVVVMFDAARSSSQPGELQIVARTLGETKHVANRSSVRTW
jgi:hypothetical protein